MDLADPNTSLLREVDPSASVLGLTPIAVPVLRVPVGCQVAHGDGNGVDPIGVPPAEELIGPVHQPVQVVELQGSHQLPSAASDPCNHDPPEQDVQQHPQDAHQEQHQQLVLSPGTSAPDDTLWHLSDSPWPDLKDLSPGWLEDLALLEARKLLQLCRTVDTPAQAKVHDLTSSMAMGFMRILPGSAQSLISGNVQYHHPFSLHLDRCNFIAPHRCRRRFDQEADRVHEHVRRVVGVSPWEDLRRLTSGSRTPSPHCKKPGALSRTPA